jgi:hypothetical protein
VRRHAQPHEVVDDEAVEETAQKIPCAARQRGAQAEDGMGGDAAAGRTAAISVILLVALATSRKRAWAKRSDFSSRRASDTRMVCGQPRAPLETARDAFLRRPAVDRAGPAGSRTPRSVRAGCRWLISVVGWCRLCRTF